MENRGWCSGRSPRARFLRPLLFSQDSCIEPSGHGAAGQCDEPFSGIAVLGLSDQGLLIREEGLKPSYVRNEKRISNLPGTIDRGFGRQPGDQFHAEHCPGRCTGAGGLLGDQGGLEPGVFACFSSLPGICVWSAQFLASANLDLQNALASLERVSALYDIFPEENMDVGQKVDRLKGEIEFKNVSFSYAGRDPVLKDVSFQVRPGEHVAIVGPSGVGKTTLISLILRFYKPTSGEITFDGRSASDLEVGSLRRRIGYVPQNITLFSGTVMENLRYGNPEASEAQVGRAARIAGIHDFICSLPLSYETEVGEKGVRLSEGEKQRLSIARALIKEPDVLVLDEPTSAVDSLTEKPILDSLPAFVRDKTLFVVAHQLSTIKGSDRILLLNESRLVAIGTHQSLLETNDYYRSVVACQQIK
jgi:ABC-type multidrug transport system fused ATPase/permease subunit